MRTLGHSKEEYIVDSLEQVKDEYILYTFYHCKGIRKDTAEALGISERCLRTYLKRLGIKPFITKQDRIDCSEELWYPSPSNEQRLRYLDDPYHGECYLKYSNWKAL